MTSNSQSTKSLGQVAYEAWALQLVHTYPPTTKHELLGTDSRHAWQAAAEAVAEELGVKRETLQECAAAEAVIEAAKAWFHQPLPEEGVPDYAHRNYWVEMMDAVEALQEVEDE